MKDIYLDFGGWAKLDANTQMQYIGEDETKPQIITVADFVKLPHNERSDYILEDFIAAIRDAEDYEFNELTVDEIEYSEELP